MAVRKPPPAPELRAALVESCRAHAEDWRNRLDDNPGYEQFVEMWEETAAEIESGAAVTLQGWHVANVAAGAGLIDIPTFRRMTYTSVVVHPDGSFEIEEDVDAARDA